MRSAKEFQINVKELEMCYRSDRVGFRKWKKIISDIYIIFYILNISWVFACHSERLLFACAVYFNIVTSWNHVYLTSKIRVQIYRKIFNHYIFDILLSYFLFRVLWQEMFTLCLYKRRLLTHFKAPYTHSHIFSLLPYNIIPTENECSESPKLL